MIAPAVLTMTEKDELCARLLRGMVRAGRLAQHVCTVSDDLWDEASDLANELAEAHIWICMGGLDS
jgi:hypothetical protein